MFEIEENDPGIADSMRRKASAAVTGLRKRLAPGSAAPPSVPLFLNLLPDAELWPKTGRIAQQRLQLVQYWRQMQRDMSPDTTDRCDVDGAMPDTAAAPAPVAPAVSGPIPLQPSSFASSGPVHAAYRLQDFDDELDDTPRAPETALVPAAENQPMTWVPASVLFAKQPLEPEQAAPAAASGPDEPSSLPASEPQTLFKTEPPPLVLSEPTPLAMIEPIAAEPIDVVETIERSEMIADVADSVEAPAALEFLEATPVHAEAAAEPLEAVPFDTLADGVADAFGAESVEEFAAGLAAADLPAPDVAALADEILVAPMPEAIAESSAPELGAEAVAGNLDDLAADLLADAFSQELAEHFHAADAGGEQKLGESVGSLNLEDLEVASSDAMPAREPVEVEMPALAAAAAVLPDVAADAVIEATAAERTEPQHNPIEMPAFIAEAAEAAEPVWVAERYDEQNAESDASVEEAEADAEAEPMAVPPAAVLTPAAFVAPMPAESTADEIHDDTWTEAEVPVSAPAAFAEPVMADAPADELRDDSWAEAEMPAAAAFATPVMADAPGDEPRDDTWTETELPAFSMPAAFATPITDDRAARDDRDEIDDDRFASDMPLPAASASFAAPLTADALGDQETAEPAADPSSFELPVPVAPAAFAAPLLARATDDADDDAPASQEPLQPVAGHRTFAELVAAGFASLRQSQPARESARKAEPDQMPSLEADPTWDAAVAEWTVDARDQRLRRAGVIPMPAAKPLSAVKAPTHFKAPRRSPVPALERFLRCAEARRRQIARESVA